MYETIPLERRLGRKLHTCYSVLANFEVSSDDSEGRRVKRVCAFYDERYGKNRSITSIDWSPKVSTPVSVYETALTHNIQYPELSCASYNKNPAALNEPDGIVAVWNLHLLERPEFVFHSQVSSASESFIACMNNKLHSPTSFQSHSRPSIRI